jgi:uncharacterized membrane-anchored protein
MGLRYFLKLRSLKHAAAGVLLATVFVSLSAFAQANPSSEASRKAELAAAWQTASNAGTGGPSEISLIDQDKRTLVRRSR